MRSHEGVFLKGVPWMMSLKSEEAVLLWMFSGAQREIFQGRGGFAELGHFDKKCC